jgi:hypothetical protein
MMFGETNAYAVCFLKLIKEKACSSKRKGEVTIK